MSTDDNPVRNERENGTNNVRKKDTPFLYLCAVTASLSVFTGCSCVVWSSPVLPKLQSRNIQDNPLGSPITSMDVALITGLPSMVAILGNLLYANLPNAIGRKKTIMFLSTGMLVSLVIVALSSHVYVYSAALSFLFTCVAGIYVAVPLYLSEISEDHNRGRIISIMGIVMPLGNLYGYLLGPLFSIEIFTFLLAVPLVIQIFLIALFVPESPVYLVRKNDNPAALMSLIKLRGNKNSIEIEADYKKIEDNERTGIHEKKSCFFKKLRIKSVRKAMIISLVMMLTQQMCGITTIIKFLGPVFNEVTDKFSGNNVAVLVGVVKFISFFICSTLVERIGRRILSLTSSLGSCIFLFIIGLFFYLKHNTSIPTDNLAWLPIFSVVAFNFMYALGIGTLAYVVMNEMFPSEIQAVASAVIYSICYLLGSLEVFLFPILSTEYGVHVCVWSFSLFCLIGFVFMVVLLPETKGKSFLEIKEMLES